MSAVVTCASGRHGGRSDKWQRSREHAGQRTYLSLLPVGPRGIRCNRLHPRCNRLQRLTERRPRKRKGARCRRGGIMLVHAVPTSTKSPSAPASPPPRSRASSASPTSSRPTPARKCCRPRRAPRLHAELRRQEPAHAAHRQAAGHGPRHLEPVLLADPAGHRRRGAARGLRGAGRRHAARRGARRALRADAEAQGSRRPDLPRPPAAEGGGGARPRDGAALRAGRQRLRVQPAPRHPERAHRQRQGGGRGDGPSLPARPPAHRHRHRPARQPAQPRSPARRRRARAKQQRAERDFVVMQRRLLDRIRRRGAPSGCSAARSRRRRSSASTTRWRWA